MVQRGLELVQLVLVAFGTLVTLSPLAMGGLIYMGLGGSGLYLADWTVLEFHTHAYNETCDLRSGDLFDITAPSVVEYDGSFWQALSGLTALLMATQTAALLFSIALAPKFPIPNRSVWKKGSPDKLGVEDLRLEDWDRCRESIFRAVDLFRPGTVLDPAPLNKLIYNDDSNGASLDWKEWWRNATGQALDDVAVRSMQKVFEYTKRAVRVRQKLVLNVQLAHLLFILQLVSTAAQSLQHAYRSNRLFWHQINTYSFSDAIVVAAYPTRLFSTIVMYCRVVVSQCMVNSFFREVSIPARVLTALAAQGIIPFYLFATPPDFVAVLAFWVCLANSQRIYNRCFKPHTSWKGICFALFTGSLLLSVPCLVHALCTWGFASSAASGTSTLRLCDMERILFWDVRGSGVADVTWNVFASLDQNVVGVVGVCLIPVVALIFAWVRFGHFQCLSNDTPNSMWTRVLGIAPGSLIKLWTLQPEYYAAGWHFSDKVEGVATVLGTTWWWHTVGLFDPTYEEEYQHAEKTFYQRRRLLDLYGLLFVPRVCTRGFNFDFGSPPELRVPSNLISLRREGSFRSIREIVLALRAVPCDECKSELMEERLPDTLLLLQSVDCLHCGQPLVDPTRSSPTVAWFCSNASCKRRVRFCGRCMHQIETGDMDWTYQRLQEIESIPDKGEQKETLGDNFVNTCCDDSAIQCTEGTALPADADVHPSSDAALSWGEPDLDVAAMPAATPEATPDVIPQATPKKFKRLKPKQRRRVRQGGLTSIQISP